MLLAEADIVNPQRLGYLDDSCYRLFQKLIRPHLMIMTGLDAALIIVINAMSAVTIVASILKRRR